MDLEIKQRASLALLLLLALSVSGCDFIGDVFEFSLWLVLIVVVVVVLLIVAVFKSFF